jgi:hypothetical protein
MMRLDAETYKANIITELSKIHNGLTNEDYINIYTKSISLYNTNHTHSGSSFEVAIEQALTQVQIPFKRQVSIDTFGNIVRIDGRKRGCSCIDIVIGDVKVGIHIKNFGVVSVKNSCRERWKQDDWSKVCIPKFYFLVTSARDYPDNDNFKESTIRKIFTSNPKNVDMRNYKLNIDDLIPQIKLYNV